MKNNNSFMKFLNIINISIAIWVVIGILLMIFMPELKAEYPKIFKTMLNFAIIPPSLTVYIIYKQKKMKDNI